MRAVEDLVAGVRDQRSRAMFNEAVRAYGAGAYRSAIISTWVTVAFDLMGKIRQLAEAGEAAAKVLIEDLDHAIDSKDIRRLQDLERGLLDACRDDFELLDARDHDALTRLYEDRHVCAHPAFVAAEEAFEASAELVRVHLATAVDSVLQHGVTAGRRAIERFTAESQGPAWPSTQDSLVAYLRERYLDRGKARLRRDLAVVVVKVVIGTADPLPDDDTRARLVDAAHAIDTIDPQLLAEALDRVVRRREEGPGLAPDELAHLVGSLGDLATVWASFPRSSVARVVAFIASSDVEMLLRAGVLSTEVVEPEIAVAIATRLSTLGAEDLSRVVAYRPAAQHVEHALQALSNAGAWRTAESHMSRLVLPVAQFIEARHLEDLLDTLESNKQVSQANGMPFLLGQLFDATHTRPDNLSTWVRIGAFLETNGQDGDRDDWFAAPDLRAKITAAAP